MKDDHQKSEIYRRKVAERDKMSEELNLKVQLLADDSYQMARLQALLTARDMEMTAMRMVASRSTKGLPALT